MPALMTRMFLPIKAT